jgi:hypothetical protein
MEMGTEAAAETAATVTLRTVENGENVREAADNKNGW